MIAHRGIRATVTTLPLQGYVVENRECIIHRFLPDDAIREIPPSFLIDRRLFKLSFTEKSNPLLSVTSGGREPSVAGR